MRRYLKGLLALAICVAAITIVSCRRNQPSLVDTNQPPDTQLWYAPPDSTDYQYLVHMFWRGSDRDGTTARFIWTIKDTLATDGFRWNPGARLSDFRAGRITTRTDSVFAFTAYKDVNGIGVRKNRQAFYVASIDDNGVIDPFPAAVEFVATIGQLPQMYFATYVGGVQRRYVHKTVPSDTVGMFKPFQISFHGTTTNGSLRAYQYFSLSTGVSIPGSSVWYEDLADTVQSFPPTPADTIPAGTFRFAARCLDEANAESQVDGGNFRRGVCQVVVNFNPETRITEVKNRYFRNGSPTPIEQDINFKDSAPDTVPYLSWIYYRYNGVDDDRDDKLCLVNNPDKCIDFQVRYVRNSSRVAGGKEDSQWLPRNGTHDADSTAASDSNSVNIGSLEYEWYARAWDENKTPDGTPPKFNIIGNFDPILDTAAMEDHFGNPLNIATVDTLHWNFYKGIGWPYSAPADTYQTNIAKYFKRFAWTLSASGHDNPKDPAGSGIKSWRYHVYTNYNPATNTGTFWPLGRAGDSWFPAATMNILDDRVELLIRYSEPDGDDLFENLPPYFNSVVTIVLYGRDTQSLEGDFEQDVFLSEVPRGQKAGSTVSTKYVINKFPAGSFGRWTPRKVIQFYLKFDR